jgi:hypothetical protein
VLRDFNRSRLPCEAGTSVPGGSVFAGSTPAVIGVCSALPGTSSGKDAATGIEPAVLTTDFTLSEPANKMQFDYEFTGAGAGTLSVLVDDTRVFLAPRLAGVSGVQSSLSIELPTLLAGVHTVAVLVEASGADPLQVAISNLRFMLASDASAGVDVVPDAFAFTAWNDVRAGALVVSDVATISGINAPAPVTVSGGEYSIGCNGVFTAATGEIRAYPTICVRHTSSSANGSTATTTLTIGSVSAAFTSTTLEPVRLGNISTRAQVLGGNDVLIGGFVIAGGASKTVVVRARGPSLVPFGIAYALANPQLQLVRSSDQATVAFNDDWPGAPNAATIAASGFAPSSASEAAILITLPPGAYTAIVTGASGGTGVGIIEVFAVQ